MNTEDIIKERISIPEYYKENIDHEVDLEKITGSIPCRLHGEKHGASFSYSKNKKVCSCFGRCHFTGDVIELHRRWQKLKDREEAIQSLASILNIEIGRATLERHKTKLNGFMIEKTSLLNKAETLARDLNSILELDYLMSQYKEDSEIIGDLKKFIERHGG